MTDGLKDKHRKTIIDILSANERVERVVLFGSRAMGTFTPTSDVDIVLYGTELTPTDRSKLAAAIDELTMPQQVDLLLHKSIKKKELLEHIEKHGVEWWRRSWDRGKDWQPSNLGDVIAVNPSRPLKKGSESVYISMQQVETANRSVSEIDHRAFKGSGARFRNGDTLLARITPCLENGKTAYVDFLDDGEVGHGSTEFIVLSGIEGISDDLFVYYLARYPEFRDFAIVRMEGSSGRQRVPASTLRKYTFACPSYDEQRAIAHILGSLDDKIELNRRMNQTLEAMARAIFKSWFVDFDPVRAKAEGRPTGLPDDIAVLFPDSFEDSEIGEIPKGWEVSRLGNIADVNWGDTSVTKKSYIEEGFLAYSAKGPDGFLPYHDYDRTGVVVSAIGANSGYTWLAQGKWSCIKNTIRFWSTDKSISTEYLYHATFGKHNWPLRGSAQPFISQGDARSIEVLFASNDLAKVFGDFVRPFYEKTIENTVEVHTLASLRDTLLPKLISGELRVQDAEKFVEEAGV